MADSPEPDPEAKRPCNTLLTLYPLESAANLQERYTEDTADVVFVGKETKERLPAHREVLKVASVIFFNMFDGNWKEKDEKEIPAPEDFSWESFKAAITLLYGEEVEVEESVIPDLYRVAHYYDLRAVMSVFAHSIQVWDHRQLSTVVELCALAGEVEAEQKQEENELIQAAVKCLAQHLDKISRAFVDITGLSYQTMLMLAQSEDITATETTVLTTLNQWLDAKPEVSMGKAKELFSHVRYGTLPYESLVQCRVGQSNLYMALGNHKELSIARLSANLTQITPRVGQKEGFLVYPMTSELAVTMQERRHKFCDISASPAVALVYSGKQEVLFEVAIQFTDENDLYQGSFVCELCSVAGGEEQNVDAVQLLVVGFDYPIALKYGRVRVNENGAHLTFYSERWSGFTESRTVPFSGPFPWLLAFGIDAIDVRYSLTFTYPTL